MELHVHHIVSVASQDGNIASILPVPDPDSLVIRGTADPGKFMVKLYCSHIINMPGKGEETFLLFIVPHSHFVVIPSTGEQRLGKVEINASDRPYVLKGEHLDLDMLE